MAETQGRSPELRAERHASRAGSTYKAFLEDLQEVGRFDRELAECAAVAVLCALERRILAEEAHDLLAQLPSKLQELVKRCALHEGEKPEKFGRDEFFRSVAADLRKAEEEVEPIVRAVITTLRAHVSEGEAEDVAAQLPRDLAELWMRPS